MAGWIRVAFVLGAALGAAGAGASGSESESRERAAALLAPHTTEQALNRYLGSQPFACGVVGENRAICSWSLGNRSPRWRALAATVSTTDRINVVCELPTEKGPRAADSCSVHPRRSNRYVWRPNPGAAKKRMKNRYSRETQKQRQARATAMLEEARTPLEVSRLVGEGPIRCSEEQSGLYRCTWFTTNQTWGHGTLAMVISAPIRKKLAMHCTFPADEGPRELESCQVEIASSA